MEQCFGQRRFALRAATAAAHEALEIEIGSIGSRKDYGRYLSVMAGFRGAIEAKLSTSAKGVEPFQPTTIYDCLVLDCADVGVREVTIAPTSIDCSEAARLGIAYVLEGSALGASLLIRFARALGYDENFGARHLSRQVAARSNWTAFVNYLEQRTLVNMPKAIDAANATFLLALAAAKESRHAA